jgi:hypothetical protein
MIAEIPVFSRKSAGKNRNDIAFLSFLMDSGHPEGIQESHLLKVVK